MTAGTHAHAVPGTARSQRGVDPRPGGRATSSSSCDCRRRTAPRCASPTSRPVSRSPATADDARPGRRRRRCRPWSRSWCSARSSCTAASPCAATWSSCRTSRGRTPGSAWTGRRHGSCPGDAVRVGADAAWSPGDLVQKALLLGALRAGRHGCRPPGPATTASVARAAAIVLMCWNPWVAERLLHRPVGPGRRVRGAAVGRAGRGPVPRRRTPRAAGPGPAGSAFSALWSPPAALLGVPDRAVRRRGAAHAADARWPLVLSVSVLVSLPWLVPSLLTRRTGSTRPGDQFEAFVARGESRRRGWWPAWCRSAGSGRRPSCPERAHRRRGRPARAR